MLDSDSRTAELVPMAVPIAFCVSTVTPERITPSETIATIRFAKKEPIPRVRDARSLTRELIRGVLPLIFRRFPHQTQWDSDARAAGLVHRWMKLLLRSRFLFPNPLVLPPSQRRLKSITILRMFHQQPWVIFDIPA